MAFHLCGASVLELANALPDQVRDVLVVPPSLIENKVDPRDLHSPLGNPSSSSYSRNTFLGSCTISTMCGTSLHYIL